MTATAGRREVAPDPLWQQSQRLLVRGHIAEARRVLAQMRARGAGVFAELLAAQLAWREDHVRVATGHALAAALAVGDDPDKLCATANILLETGESVAARDCLDRLSLDGSDDARLLERVAALRKRLHQYAEALALLERARRLAPERASLRYALGVSLITAGRLDAAEAELAASLAAAPAHGVVAVPLVRLRPQTPESNHLEALDTGAALARPGSIDAAAFAFARYKTVEDLGRDAEAWQALARGNALMHARLPDGAAEHRAWLDRFLAVWPVTAAIPPAPPAGPQPIFIVGLPRTGTTVLERMLGNHSRVAVAGELADFGAQLHWMTDTRNAHSDALTARLPGVDFAELGRRYLERTRWRAGGKDFFIDKQPPNWVMVGAIHAALPGAPILNLVRDPMDTCFSNFRAYFGDACAYSYDLAALAAVFQDYRRACAHWHRILPDAVLDVPYPDLVRSPDSTLRRVFAFCGLDWEPACTDITRNAAPSATLSAAAVRSPLHTRAFGEWRRYAAHLEPLAVALAAPAVK
ncbi:MAG TPA: sulfotransferase [Rhodanobacteraceae bacterium]